MLGVGRKPLNFPDGWAPGFSAENVTSLHGLRLPQSRNTLAHVSGKRRVSLLRKSTARVRRRSGWRERLSRTYNAQQPKPSRINRRTD